MKTSGSYPPEYDQLSTIEQSIWDRLSNSVVDRHCPGHTPTFGSLAKDGSPRLRTVVLRGCDADQRRLTFHTDQRSRKWQQLQSDPRASMHFYFPKAKLQYRLQGSVMLERATERTQQIWQRMNHSAQDCYRVKTAPGTFVPEPTSRAVDTAGDHDGYRDFTRVHLRITTIDWLFLSAAGHRRAHFAWTESGQEQSWVAP